MPQLHLLPHDQNMTGLVLKAWTPQPGIREHTEIQVSVGLNHRDPMPLWHVKVVGVEADYLDTYASTAMTAWAYEATRRDVSRALTAVQRLARAHRASSEY